MTFRAWAMLTSAAALTAVGGELAWDARIPLGVPGEWVWNRSLRPPVIHYLFPVLASAALLWIAAAGRRAFAERRAHRWTWAAGMFVGAAGWQASLIQLPAPALGMERWPLALASKATSGYFEVAKDLRRRNITTADFLRDYRVWLADQDSFHIGTHPPGLFLLNYWTLQFFEERPALSARVSAWLPERFKAGGALLVEPPTAPQWATLGALAFAAWFSGLLTIPLVYALARQACDAAGAWTAACLWATTPQFLLFLPLADAAFPFLAATIVLAVAVGARCGGVCGVLLAGFAGFLTAAAMTLTLAFLVAAAFAFAPWLAEAVRTRSLRRLIFPALGFGLGFGVFLAWMHVGWQLPLVEVWRTNLEKHRGFYEHMPRTYLTWIAVNAVEFAVVCGVPTVLAVFALGRRPFGLPLAATVLGTLLALDVTGKNLSEVARLWLFAAPLVAAAGGRSAEANFLSPRVALLLLAMQVFLAISLVSAVEPLLPVNLLTRGV